jgi:hypothetical protein
LQIDGCFVRARFQQPGFEEEQLLVVLDQAVPLAEAILEHRQEIEETVLRVYREQTVTLSIERDRLLSELSELRRKKAELVFS